MTFVLGLVVMLLFAFTYIGFVGEVVAALCLLALAEKVVARLVRRKPVPIPQP